MKQSDSKEKLIEALKAKPWDAWVTQWYDDPIIEGRRASFGFSGVIPYSELRTCSHEALNSLVGRINDLTEDEFDGHWNIGFTDDHAIYWFYLGGPGSNPPPPPPPGDDD